MLTNVARLNIIICFVCFSKQGYQCVILRKKSDSVIEMTAGMSLNNAIKLFTFGVCIELGASNPSAYNGFSLYTNAKSQEPLRLKLFPKVEKERIP